MTIENDLKGARKGLSFAILEMQQMYAGDEHIEKLTNAIENFVAVKFNELMEKKAKEDWSHLFPQGSNEV